uniref:ABC transporter domain-containing protein n=1 Tax=Bicosoecida sp. CB-2014 TaxID=1486930 RepID=A0A7S1C7Q0_9STRA
MEMAAAEASSHASKRARKKAKKQRMKAAAGDEGGEGSASGGAGGDVETAADVKLQSFDLMSKGDSGVLLADANLTLARGRRYGLVGRNGCGKTTLLSAIARREIAGIPGKMRVTLVKQEVVGTDDSAVQAVLAADMAREVLAMREKRLMEVIAEVAKERGSVVKSGPLAGTTSDALEAQLADVRDAIAAAEDAAGEAEARAIRILTGLGFTPELRSKPTRELSGGWRMRVAIAAGLFSAPDLLLLDEPTNHLDLEIVWWLAAYLQTRMPRTTLLIVSHDRAFLNAVVTDVVYFNRGTLTSYRGDIASFDEVRRARAVQQARQREAQEMKRAHMQEYITKHAQLGSNGPKAAAQRKSRMKKMDRLGVEAAGAGKRYKLSYDAPAEEVAEVEEDEEVTLTFPHPGAEFPRDLPLVSLDDVSFSYPVKGAGAPPSGAKPHLLNNVNFSVSQTSRVALLGRNGAGKSTLLRLLIGDEDPVSGIANRNRHCRIEYIAQHQVDQLDLHSTPLDFILTLHPGDGSRTHIQAMRQHLASFGLGGDVLPLQRIYTLSGGQKCRLCLAVAMYTRPHLVVLDEPSNHLDAETIDALMSAVRDFGGGALIVSHDEYLLSHVCEDLWVVGDGEVKKYRGTFQDYKKEVMKTLA